jgi:bacterioferritin
MKGSQKVIDALNDALADELAAINQYMIHAEMAANWGYGKFEHYVEERAIQEMKHAEKLIGRILFLEGNPVVTNVREVYIGDFLDKGLNNDHASELEAIAKYNAIVKLCVTENDQGTKEMVDHILMDEEAHIDGIEERIDQITQMGLQNYLTTVVG